MVGEELALEQQPSEEVMWVPETYRCLMTRISGHQKSPFDTLPQLCEQIHRGYPYNQERSGLGPIHMISEDTSGGGGSAQLPPNNPYYLLGGLLFRSELFLSPCPFFIFRHGLLPKQLGWLHVIDNTKYHLPHQNFDYYPRCFAFSLSYRRKGPATTCI